MIPASARLTWGILGTGRVAREFARGIAASQTSLVLAVGSRTPASAASFARAFGVERHYPAYDAVLADPDVDAVYIALPNSMHAQWAIRAAQAGKHILCEKPFTANAGEAERVIAAARRNDVFLLEAMLYRNFPHTARVDQLVRNGTIGAVRLIEGRFGTDLGPQYDNIRLSRDLAGGGIMDVGSYVASYVVLLTADEPLAVTGVAQIGERSHVDEWAAASILFSSGTVASLVCGTQVATARDLWLWGDEGSIHVFDPWKPWQETSMIVVQRKGAEPEEITFALDGDPWLRVTDTIHRHIADRQVPRPGMTWDDSLATMRVLDSWRKSAGLVFDADR